MALIGNPGTGKTKVARLLPKLLHSLGAICRNAYVEVNREDLVASHIGGTAKLTKEKIEEARGGVMFIDEAYRLSDSRSSNDFGPEAIETIMVEMTKDCEDTVVFLFAGYPERMERFLKTNPGMDRRVAHRFDFQDYTINEMVQIVETAVRFKGFQMACGREALATTIEQASSQAQRARLNGGVADLLVPEAIRHLNGRLEDDAVGDGLVTLQEEDFVAACTAIHWPSD